MTHQLVRYEAARTALAAAHSVDEVKDIRDKAEAMAAYARQAKDQELILWATEIKVRAERRCGEMLATIPRGGKFLGKNEDGDFRKTDGAKTETVQRLGLSKEQSSRFQQLASMSSEHFEAAVATAKDTAGQVTTAFMLREAARHRVPSKKLTKVGKAQLEKLDQAKSNSMLIAYSRMVLKSLREAESLSEQERVTLGQLGTEIDRALALQ
jgi:hypothetical protein